MADSRGAAILENILGAQNELEAPQSDLEEILLAILNEGTYTKEERSRIETILLAILNGTECSITDPRSECEEILLYIYNKAIYDGETNSTISELLSLWAKQEADPARFRFPFAINQGQPVEMSVEEEEG